MPEINPVGDVVLKDARAMRAIADASRFALHDVVRRSGPATVSELASRLDAEPHTIVEALKALERSSSSNGLARTNGGL